MVTTGVVVAQSVLVVQKEDIIFQFKMRDDDVSNKDYLLCVLYILSTYSAQRELLSLLLLLLLPLSLLLRRSPGVYGVFFAFLFFLHF